MPIDFKIDPIKPGEFSQDSISKQIDLWFEKFLEKNPAIDKENILDNYLLNIQMHKEFLDAFTNSIQGDSALKASNTNLALTVFAQNTFAKKAKAELGFYFPQGIVLVYEGCLQQDEFGTPIAPPSPSQPEGIPATPRQPGRTQKLAKDLCALFQDEALKAVIRRYKGKYGENVAEWGFTARAELCKEIYQDLLDPKILRPMQDALPTEDLNKKTVSPFIHYTTAIVKANFIVQTGLPLSRGFILGEQHAKDIEAIYGKYPVQVEQQLEEIVNFYNRMEQVQIPQSKQKYNTEKVTFGMLCDLSGFTRDFVNDQQDKLTNIFLTPVTKAIENMLGGPNAEESANARDIIRKYRESRIDEAKLTEDLTKLLTGNKVAAEEEISRVIDGIKLAKESGREIASFVRGVAISENKRLTGYYIDPEALQSFQTVTKEAKAAVGRDKDANIVIDYAQLPVETKLEINKKFSDVLKQFEGSFDKDTSLTQQKRGELKAEARQFIKEQQKEYTGISIENPEVGQVALAMAKASLKPGKDEKPVAVPSAHFQAIFDSLVALTPQQQQQFITKYNDDPNAINKMLPKSDNIAKNAAKLYYLQNMVEKPELFQEVFDDVRPKDKFGKPSLFQINDKFVQKFNKQFEVVRGQPKKATIVQSSAPGSNQLAVANPDAVDVVGLEELVNMGRSTVAADGPALAPQEKPKASVTEQEFAAKATKMRQEIIDVENVITRGLFDLVTANGGKINFKDKTFTNAIDVYLNTEVKKVEKGANEQTVQSIKATQTGINQNIQELEDRGADKKACDNLRAEITSSCESFKTALTTEAGIEGLFADLLKRESLKSIPLNKKEEKDGPSAKAGDIRPLVMDEKREIADKLFPAITIPKGFASVLFTNPQIVSDVLRPIVNNRIIEAFSKTENGKKILDETKLTPDNIQKFGQKVGDDIAAYCVAKQSVEALRTNGKKISPETENQIIKDLAPKLSTLGSQYLQDNQGRLTKELAGNIAKEQTVTSKVFGSFKISAESLVKIDVSQKDKIDASLLSPNLTPQEQAIIGGVATRSPPLEISAPDSNKLLGKQAPVITVLNASSNLPKKESTLSSTTPVTKAVVPPPPPLKPARDNQAAPVLTDKQREHRDAQKQLLKAASEGNAPEVSRLLQTQKANLTKEDKGEALRIAAGKADNVTVAAILHNAKDDISSRDKGEALRRAASESEKTPPKESVKKREVVKTLLKAGGIHTDDREEANRHASPKTRKVFDKSEQGRFEELGAKGHVLRNAIRDYGAKKTTDGYTLSTEIRSERQKSKDIPSLLQGANRHDKIEGLRIAAKHGKTDIVPMILEKIDIHREERGLGEALRVAAKYGNNDIVDMLLDKAGKDISPRDKGEALRVAAKNGHADVVDKLLDKAGKDISSRDKGEANREAKDAKHEGIAGAIKEHMKEDYNKRHTPPSRPAPRPQNGKVNPDLLQALQRAEVESQRAPKEQKRQNKPPNSSAPGNKYPPDIQRFVDAINMPPPSKKGKAARENRPPTGPHVAALKGGKGQGGSNVSHH